MAATIGVTIPHADAMLTPPDSGRDFSLQLAIHLPRTASPQCCSARDAHASPDSGQRSSRSQSTQTTTRIDGFFSTTLGSSRGLRALTWFAIGSYYYCTQNFLESRRSFSKATTIEGTFAPAWIGFGNAFAAQDESDQAMAAFRKCSRLFPGCHLPVLYIGLEYMRTHNFRLAEQLFLRAKSICPADPLVYHELGVVAYRTHEYQKAVRWFEKTLSQVPLPLTEAWEPTLVNMAHALRKLQRYSEAIKFYERALDLSSRSVSLFAGLAFTYHLLGNYHEAVHLYHKALVLRPEDQFCAEMLTIALADSCRTQFL